MSWYNDPSIKSRPKKEYWLLFRTRRNECRHLKGFKNNRNIKEKQLFKLISRRCFLLVHQVVFFLQTGQQPAQKNTRPDGTILHTVLCERFVRSHLIKLQKIEPKIIFMLQRREINRELIPLAAEKRWELYIKLGVPIDFRWLDSCSRICYQCYDEDSS